MLKICQLDKDLYYVGVVEADISPLEPEVYLIPAGAIEAELPQIPEGKRAKWDGAWVYENLPAPPEEPEELPPTEAEKKQMEINLLKYKLIESDYVVLPDYDKYKPEIIEQRKQWRTELRALEAEYDYLYPKV
jgi:hypothetical protein